MTENKRFELIDDYIISYDGDYFDLHKLSDIRSFVTVVGYVIDENEQLKDENEYYKSLFSKIVETALTDKNCREEWCKAILNIFDKANSLNQAREMIQARLK